MSILLKTEIAELIKNPDTPSVSIFMRTSRVSDKQGAIRFKNLLREAENQLSVNGTETNNIKEILKPAEKLLKDVAFWQHQADGLAVFLSPTVFRYYLTPYKFKELAIAGDYFHIKPLLPLFNENEVFYILALSQNSCRLLQCNRYDVRDVTPKDMPSSLAEALRFDDPQKQHQYHTTGPDGSAIYHGQGVSKDFDKDAILRYFQKINKGLHELLRDAHSPLILAAVDYLHPIYREANSYQYLFKEGVVGNPDEEKDDELRRKAWSILRPHIEERRNQALASYHETAGTGLATNELEEIMFAALEGRVAVLFVADGIQIWGNIDKEKRKIELFKKQTAGSEELLNLAASNTILTGGTVYSLKSDEISEKASAMAIFRY